MTRHIVCTGIVCLVLGWSVDSRGEGAALERSFSLGQTPRVKVNSIRGPITVAAGKQDRVTVRAVKEGGSEADRQALKVEVEPGDGALTVNTRCTRRLGSCGKARVRYTLTVPARARLALKAVSGRVKVSGLSGALTARTVSGAVEARGAPGQVAASTVSGRVMLRLAATPRSVKASTVSGRIEIKLPGQARATVALSTISGNLTSHLPLRTSRRCRRSLVGIMGPGDGPKNRIKASTVSGGITLSGDA